jgi:hypothetical protein
MHSSRTAKIYALRRITATTKRILHMSICEARMDTFQITVLCSSRSNLPHTWNGVLSGTSWHIIEGARAYHLAVAEHDLITVSFRLSYMICNPNIFTFTSRQAIVRTGKGFICIFF